MHGNTYTVTLADVDCGGGTCAPCALSKSCAAHSDCAGASVTCAVKATGKRLLKDRNEQENENENENETHGGVNGNNDGTNDGVDGNNDGTHTSGDSAKACTTVPTCTDRSKNGLETDKDCGGASGCAKCALGKKCSVGSDCASGTCKSKKCK